MSFIVRGLVGLMLLIVGAAPQTLAIGPGFTFQGRVSDNDLPLEGTVDLVFTLHDAATDGSQIGANVTLVGVSVVNGLINAEINAADEFGADAFSGEDRWLEVSIDGTPLSPRQKITASPYAITASTLAPGAAVTGTGDVLTVESTGGSSNHALSGIASGGSANVVGVYGEITGTTGRGVFGNATSTSGATAGVRGESASTASNATGVFGLIASPSGTGAGVKGQNNGTNGYGVWGTGGANAVGVLGQGSGNNGVWAISSSAAALRVETTAAGNLIEGWTQSPVNKRFQVDASGNVTADGTYTSPAADFAELLPAASGLEPGDVLSVGSDGTLRASGRAFEPSVVGVHSTRPAFLGGHTDDAAARGDVPLAVVGIVPVKASAQNGPIAAGDMLVASDTPGHAMRAGSAPPQGTVIGKALTGLDEGTGTVTLLVMMQ